MSSRGPFLGIRSRLPKSWRAGWGGDSARAGAICALLALVTVLTYWPITTCGFINYDDPLYITDNPVVKAGLSWRGAAWAFTTGAVCNWHPLAWLSHMLDCQLYGLNAGGHHLTSLLLHAANVLLLFLLLDRMTGARWRSVLVAALFALHPLHVESVAWVSERKDLLSTFFFLLSLMAYANYAKARPYPETAGGTLGPRAGGFFDPARYYFSALCFFALGLMSKPMVVTLPFVLLLLDYWPLQRFRISNLKSEIPVLLRLVAEKALFFLLAIAASVVTFLVQRAGGAVSSLETSPLTARTANALVSYLRYISKTFWPANLSVFYPYPDHWSGYLVLTALLLVTVWTAVVLVLARRRGYLVVGWLWFLGTLVPTIGLVQVGSQSIADRYMYIPSIGLFVALVWGLHDLLARVRAGRQAGVAVGVMASLACAVCTVTQVRYWKTDEKLFLHAMQVTTDNYLAYVHVPDSVLSPLQKRQTIDYLFETVRWNPHYAQAQYDLGTRLMEFGRAEEAIPHLRSALEIDPALSRACRNLGKALLTQGRVEEAILYLSRAVALDPDSPEAHYNLATAMLGTANPANAIAEFSTALRLDPNYAEAHMNLGVALIRQGKPADALAHFAEAVRLAPENPEARFNFGLALLDQGRSGEAAEQFAAQARLAPADPRAHYHLAIALARIDRPQDAILQYRETLRLAPDSPEIAKELALLEKSR